MTSSYGKSYEKRSISAEAAQGMVAAAAVKATEIGVPMCIAVCDESGARLLPMDGFLPGKPAD